MNPYEISGINSIVGASGGIVIDDDSSTIKADTYKNLGDSTFAFNTGGGWEVSTDGGDIYLSGGNINDVGSMYAEELTVGGNLFIGDQSNNTGFFDGGDGIINVSGTLNMNGGTVMLEEHASISMGEATVWANGAIVQLQGGEIDLLGTPIKFGEYSTLYWDNGDIVLEAESSVRFDSGVRFSQETFIADQLPTSNPKVAGQIWNDAGTLKVSAG